MPIGTPPFPPEVHLDQKSTSINSLLPRLEAYANQTTNDTMNLNIPTADVTSMDTTTTDYNSGIILNDNSLGSDAGNPESTGRRGSKADAFRALNCYTDCYAIPVQVECAKHTTTLWETGTDMTGGADQKAEREDRAASEDNESRPYFEHAVYYRGSPVEDRLY